MARARRRGKSDTLRQMEAGQTITVPYFDDTDYNSWLSVKAKVQKDWDVKYSFRHFKGDTEFIIKRVR